MTLKTRIFAFHPRVSLARFTFCWKRHNRLAMASQWPDNCDANTWQVISNSLDIDFIHGDIHGRSCKKMVYSMMANMAFEKTLYRNGNSITNRPYNFHARQKAITYIYIHWRKYLCNHPLWSTFSFSLNCSFIVIFSWRQVVGNHHGCNVVFVDVD